MRLLRYYKLLASFLLAMSTVLTLSSLALAQTTVTNYPVTNDTFVRSSAANNSFGWGGNVMVGGWGDMMIGMLKVNNFASLPVLGTGKAELWVFNVASGYAPTQVQVGLAGLPWSESTTWNSGLSWYTATITTSNVSSGGYWSAIDVTAGYNMAKGGQVPYYGWYLVPVNTNGQFNFFASAEHSNTAWRPFVRVTVPVVSTKFLDFPLSATLYPQGAYTAGKITTVLDHSMTTAYTSPDGTILTFTGEQFVTDSKHPIVKNACYPIKTGMTWSTLLKSLYYGTTYDGCGSGVAMNYESHTGYDYRADMGTEVYAAAAGKVVSANGGCIPKGLPAGCAAWGAVGIDHENGIVTQYLHLSKIEVVAGQKITAGMRIGLSGKTSPAGSKLDVHLHFETLKRRAGYQDNDYQPDHYAYIDPYGFDASKGPTDYLANTTGTAGGMPSVCLWKSGCTNP